MKPREIVELVLKEAKARGADDWWDCIDEEDQAEILFDITAVLEGFLWRETDMFGRAVLHE
jgi:hypothetical protein